MEIRLPTLTPVRTESWRSTEILLPVGLLGLAALGWWWSARMARMEMDAAESISLAAFWLAWVAMMTAMMFPAIIPVVRLYVRAAARGKVAPTPWFLAGYLVVWSAAGLPAFAVWRELMMPLSEGAAWAGRLAGGVCIGAALYQLTPLKTMCLQHCRSPLSFFMRFGRRVERPGGALRMGVTHGAFCLGCCWALMAVLVALGTMQLWWMTGLAALIFAEKNLRWGRSIGRLAAAAFAGIGLALLIHPALVTQFV